MAVPPVESRDRLERLETVRRRLADPEQEPGRERDPAAPRCLDRREARRGVLARRALVRLHPRRRLEHQPHARVHLGEQLELLLVEHPRVRVRQEPAIDGLETEPAAVLEDGSLADGGELGPEARHLLRPLAEGEEGLGAARAGAVVENGRDLAGPHQGFRARRAGENRSTRTGSGRPWSAAGRRSART